MDLIDTLPLNSTGLRKSLHVANQIKNQSTKTSFDDIHEFSEDCPLGYYTDSTESYHVALHLISAMPDEIFANDVYYADILCAAKHVYGCSREQRDFSSNEFVILLEKKTAGLERNIRGDWKSCRFSRDKYTEKAIGEILRDEYPEIYNQWQSMWIRGTMNKIFSGSVNRGGQLEIDTQELAILLYKFFWLDYIFYNEPPRGKWFIMSSGILREIQSPIDDMYCRLYDEARIWRIEYNGQFFTEPAFQILAEGFQNVSFQGAFRAFRRAIGNMHKAGNVLGPIKNRFTPLFSKKMNDDPERMLWKNGRMTVATTTRIEVVTPHIEDFYTTVTGCDLPDRDDQPDEEDLRFLEEWLMQVYPENTHRFILTDWAGILRGGNPFKLLRCLTGVGSNSKTCIMSLLGGMLGEYCVSTNISILMNSMNGAATTELAKSIDKRLTLINETGSSQTADAEQSKLLTGDEDMLSYRQLYGESKSSKIYTKIYVVCNEIFRINNADTAMQKRFEVHPHLAQWVHNPNAPEHKNKTRIYKIDTSFSTKIKALTSTLAWMLVYEYYPEYVGWLKDSTKRSLPDLFKDEQRKQWIKVCELSGFVNNSVTQTCNAEDSVDIELLIRNYNYERKKPPKSNYDSLREKIISLCFSDAQIIGENIHGYKFKSTTSNQPVGPTGPTGGGFAPRPKINLLVAPSPGVTASAARPNA